MPINTFGVSITRQPSNETKIKKRISQERVITRQFNSVLWSKQIKFNRKPKIYMALVEGVVTYRAEVCDMTERKKCNLKTMEMIFCCGPTLKDRIRTRKSEAE